MSFLRSPKLWLMLVSLAAVGFLVWRDLERTSPGPLSAAHEQVDELRGSEGCDVCHGEIDQSLADACGSCHAGVLADLEAKTGLHGPLRAGDECERCHRDHLGAGYALVDDKTFSLAGYRTREEFDHSVSDFRLAGRHAELGCADCHQNADVLLLVEGYSRYRGLDQDCASCHDDVHEGRMRTACADCHGQERPFAEVAAFEHTELTLDGYHLELACGDCHPAEGQHSVLELGAGTSPTTRACADCHESPHTAAFLTGAPECESCHRTTDAAFLADRTTMPPELHAASGFVLEVPHAQLACEECHAGREVAFRERFPGRAAEDCAACHADPHAGQFGEQSCAACHLPHTFTPSRFDVVAHAATAFPLEGSHADAACNACHATDEHEAPRRFAGTEQSCAACHATAHADLLVTRPGAAADDCGRCHVPTRFADEARTAFEHDADTRFVLLGAHTDLACEVCHVARETPDDSGRRFGLAPSGESCESCHLDPHAGRFADAGCAACHDERSFRTAATAFDHTARTGFVLDGAHARADCEACHTRSPEPNALGRTLGVVSELFGEPVDACVTCHEDVHRGAFDALGSDCAACHTTDAFDALRTSFDHARWTGYPLSPEHAGLACIACHADQAGTATHAPAAGRACDDCHADPHVGQFASDSGTDCARCHLDAGGLGFDHDRDSRFALDATHAKLDCGRCHQPWPLANGREVVRYRPLGVRCSDCHGPEYGGGR